jgi:hypothetical protein
MRGHDSLRCIRQSEGITEISTPGHREGTKSMIENGTPRRRATGDIRAARYAFALAIVICSGVGVYFTIEDPTSLRLKLSGLGINLVASALFATVFAVLVDQEHSSVVAQQFDERFAEHSARLMEALTKLNSDYLPSAVHAPAASFDPVLNKKIIDDLNRSSFYYFRGPSAKYIAARLRGLRRRPDLVRIYLPGPRATPSISFDIANRSRTGDASADASALTQRFRDDLLSSLLGLFDCRAYGRIEVHLCDDTLVARYEVTEQHMYISWYTSLDNLRGGKFPETTVFPRSSLHHQAMMIDMERRADLASDSIVITPDLSRKEFIEKLEVIFGSSWPEADLVEITRRYWAARAGFLEFLNQL